MKKRIILLLVLLTIWGCSNSNNEEKDSDDVNYSDIIASDATPSECNSKADCSERMYCDLEKKICLEGDCYDNRDCNAGYLCDMARHYCYFVGCSRNSDCREGICKRNTGKCVECLTDSDCEKGSCNSALGLCSSSDCIDDKIEPNDTFSQAYAIDSGIRKLKLCPGDDDYFKIPLSTYDTLKVIVKSESVKPIEIYLFYEKDRESPVAYTSIVKYGELKYSSVSYQGIYFLKIKASDVEISYEMEINISSLESCEDDLFENNDNELQAKSLTSGIYRDLILCPKDEDYYLINLNIDDTVSIKISGEDLFADLKNAKGESQALKINKQNTIKAEYSGAMTLRVFSTGETPSKYSMEISIDSLNNCADDPLEENDNINSAKELILNREMPLTLCKGDEDWFVIKTYQNPTTIELKADISINFEIYSSSSEEPILYSDEVATGITRAEFENLPDKLFIRVIPKEEKVDYSIKVTTTITECIDDKYEDNDSVETATDLSVESISDLKICPSDEDYYSYSLNRGDRIHIEVEFNSEMADIDIVLFDPLHKEVAYSIGSSGKEVIDYTAQISGNHILNVFAWDNKPAAYSIKTTINRSSLCLDDRFEDNDSIQSATRLNSDEIYGLVICPQDYDYYSIALNKGDRLSTGVFYDESKGKLYSALLSSDGKSIFATGENQSGDIVLSIEAPYSGDYILLVRGANNTVHNNYDLLIDIKQGHLCNDDIYEENDSISYSPAISKGIMNNLVLCPQDVDIYRIFLNTKDIILVESTVENAQSADYSITLLDKTERVLDYLQGSKTQKSLITEIPSDGYYYIAIKNASPYAYNYKLNVQVDGSGGTRGDEVITIYPFDKIDQNNPALYELDFKRVPDGAVVEALYISLIVEHRSLSDLIISAQFSDAREETLWNGEGGSTDMGLDDDTEDDSDIELYNRPLVSAKGKDARSSLLIMVEDYSKYSGTIYAIEARLFWKMK